MGRIRTVVIPVAEGVGQTTEPPFWRDLTTEQKLDHIFFYGRTIFSLSRITARSASATSSGSKANATVLMRSASRRSRNGHRRSRTPIWARQRDSRSRVCRRQGLANAEGLKKYAGRYQIHFTKGGDKRWWRSRSLQTTRLHDNHRTTHVTVWYRWHPLFGQCLRLVKERHVGSRDVLFCEFPDGSTGPISAWMADADFCARLSLGPPMASLPALVALRRFLDAFKKQPPRVDAPGERKVKPSTILSHGGVTGEGESRQEVSDDSTAQAPGDATRP